MRVLKATLVTVLLLTTLATLTGCIMIPRHKYYDDIDPQNVSSVAIYDLRGDDFYSDEFLEIEEPVYTLADDKLQDFFDDLATVCFDDSIIIVIAAIDPSFDYGDWVVRINYTDGSYSLISSDGYGQTFNKDNEMIDSNHYGCDREEWAQFIGRHIPAELFEEPSAVE